MLSRLSDWWHRKPLSEEELERQEAALLARTPIPVIWLFGKTGSGKSSIIREITGTSTAEVGSGFRPCTRTSEEYDFPDAEQPIVKFLDTRGLGEAAYDPAEDIAAFESRAHVVLVTVRVVDHALTEMLAPLRKIRAAQPSRPVILALTCLHEAYPGEQHPQPDPFASGELIPNGLPDDLRRCLELQRERFAGLVDRIVPIDLTAADSGFTPIDLGANRLNATLMELLPTAYRQTLLQLTEELAPLRNALEKQALPIILSYSGLCATASAAPLPWVDIPVVMGLQSHMVYRLAELYGQKMEAEWLLKMAGAVGGRLLARFAVRAPLKFIPFLGSTVNAAMSFAYTFSLGKACCWYFGRVRQGVVPTQEELDKVWSEQLQRALERWKGRQESGR